MDDRSRNAGGLGPLLILGIVLWVLLSGRTQPPDPPPDPDPTPIADWVAARAGQVTGSTAAAEAAAIAANYAAVAAEIETLADPLSTSTLTRPEKAIAAVEAANQRTLGGRVSAWSSFFDALAARCDQLDADGQIARSVYGVGSVYTQVAEGLQRVRGPPSDSPIRTVSRLAAEGTADFDPEAAYLSGQVTGALIDEPGQPEWARKLARDGDAEFRAAGGEDVAQAFPRAFAGEGRGKRAVYWNYALRFHNDPLPVFAIKQITGNCVEASNGDVTQTHLLGVEIFLLRKPYTWEGPGSTLFYARRGHCGQGMNLGTAAAAHLEDGTAWRKPYLGGKYDLRDTLADQQFSRDRCRNPESSLADLWAETRKTPIGRVAKFDGGVDEAMDVLFAGGALHTGSTATARRDGDPVSSGGSVGSHAQTCIGYDDTDEFRAWYKQTTGKAISEPVLMFDQTWGDEPYVKENWPAHLWGRPTPGMFVLRWSDARRLIGSTCYAYWPDLQGVTPEKIEWRLRHAQRGSPSLRGTAYCVGRASAYHPLIPKEPRPCLAETTPKKCGR